MPSETFHRNGGGVLVEEPPFVDETMALPVAPPIGEAPTLIPEPLTPIPGRALRQGCYLLNLQFASSPNRIYDGTLRVERTSAGVTASGDLYQRPVLFLPIPILPVVGGYKPVVEPHQPVAAALPEPLQNPATLPNPLIGPGRWIVLPGPNPADGIPIFSLNFYRYYLRVAKILEFSTFIGHFTLEFGMYRYDATARTYTFEQKATAEMAWGVAPAGYPAPDEYLSGDLKSADGALIGRLTMGWVAPSLRRATVEIDKVTAAEWPLNNGSRLGWHEIFAPVGWDVRAEPSDADIPEPASGRCWTDADLHAVMLKRRGGSGPMRDWRYYLLCVSKLCSTERGIMFDAGAPDSNNMPREGAAIAAGWIFPNDPMWGRCRGLRFGACAGPYFRTAVHEIGHAFLLYHPISPTGNFIMQVTPQIAANAHSPVQFPDNIVWSFAPEDAYKLRHAPDMAVRPGGVPFGANVPMSPPDEWMIIQGLSLNVDPLLPDVPIGAPVRVNFALLNQGATAAPVPAQLGMKYGCVKGKVIDASGIERSFSPVAIYLDDLKLQSLDVGASAGDSLTLLRGGDGALFPTPGRYRIVVEVSWAMDGMLFKQTGETAVMVTPAVDGEHAAAANSVLSTPDTLLTLALGGDHLADGIEAVQTALRNPELRPHFAYIEAKRLAQLSGKRKAGIGRAAELLDKQTVMSPAEVAKMARLAQESDSESAAHSIATTLRHTIKSVKVSAEVKAMVDAL